MSMFPPRPKPKALPIKSVENLQFISGKQFGVYLPQKSQKILRNALINISRPISSKLSNRTGISSNSSSRPVSAYRNIRKTENSSLQKCTQIQSGNISPPKPTSKYWGIYQLKSQKMIYGVRISKRIEVASLTKIMNLYTIVKLIQIHNLNPKQIKVTMSELATSMIGTSALLKKRDLVSLQDLLYGMMLPSGNDAACQIAMIGGTILKLAQLDKMNKIYDRQYIQNLLQCRSNIVRYLIVMNKLSHKLNMRKTKWSNVHGLSNKQNKTTIQDMCYLCKQAITIPYIYKIVNTKKYICTVQSYFGIQNEQNRIIQWQNTNKMLWKGWNGIKTGVTPNAGPCLAALYKDKNQQKQYLVIIADCVSMNQRWNQVENIVNWAIANQQN